MGSRLVVYADGSGDARAGRPGGWAWALVRDDELLAEGWGRAAHTSCLSMELLAAREGLEAAARSGWTGEVELVSDCAIALDVARGRFMPKPAQHHADAASLRAAAQAVGAVTRWVRAHAGDAWNEAVDAMARAARLEEA